MSVLCTNDKGWVISHYDYTKKIYTNVLSHSGVINLTYNQNLFGIMTPLMRDQEVRNLVLKEICEKEFVLSEDIKRKRAKSQFDNEVKIVEENYSELISLASANNIFNTKPSREDYLSNNKYAREAAELYDSSFPGVPFCNGGNDSDNSLLIKIANKSSVVPPRCKFFSSDVRLIHEKVNEEFDFILMDPPWRNKFVRRKNTSNKGYSMLSDDDIRNIPIRKLLKNSGLVGIWCTNSPSHINEVREKIFKTWGLEYAATWFWVKVTKCGIPICSFDNNNGKKPYERIIFGARPNRAKNPEEGKIIISVPSSIHSHKPPLNDILVNYLLMEPSCIEIFARYLLPGWTSLGNQVLSLQSLDLFEYC